MEADVMGSFANMVAEFPRSETINGYLKSGEAFITSPAERSSSGTWYESKRQNLPKWAQAEAMKILRGHQSVPIDPA